MIIKDEDGKTKQVCKNGVCRAYDPNRELSGKEKENCIRFAEKNRRK